MIDEYDPLKGEMFQVLDDKGEVISAHEPSLSEENLKKIYRLMVLCRMSDDKSFKLQRQGRMGTFAPSTGHEACQVGSAFPLKNTDRVFPYFRDLGMYLTLGFPLKNYFLYWMGNEKGMEIPEKLHIFPLAIPVSSQLPHSVGAGMAALIQKKKIAVLSTVGDGGTSEGDFHESLNFAGVFRTPNVFVCVNNQWAISMPREKQTASRTIAQKALAYGFSGILVDGNDVLAMFAAAKEALEKARRGGGPTLIEASTYRMSNHTTADDATKYRTDTEVEKWARKDPIKRFTAYLKKRGIWTPSFAASVKKESEDLISQAVKEAENTPPPTIDELFLYTYKNIPQKLEAQMGDLKNYLKESGQ